MKDPATARWNERISVAMEAQRHELVKIGSSRVDVFTKFLQVILLLLDLRVQHYSYYEVISRRRRLIIRLTCFVRLVKLVGNSG